MGPSLFCSSISSESFAFDCLVRSLSFYAQSFISFGLGVRRRFFPYPLSPDRERRLNRFDFALWPDPLLLVQHPGQSPLDAQKPNLSHVASRHSFRARFALEDVSRVPFPLPMIVAEERLVVAINCRHIQRNRRQKPQPFDFEHPRNPRLSRCFPALLFLGNHRLKELLKTWVFP